MMLGGKLPLMVFDSYLHLIEISHTKNARKWCRDYEFEEERKKYHFLPKLILQSWGL
jgi:hypothetical protein